MNKHITPRVAAAALAASTTLALAGPAFAQRPNGQLDGPPPLFSGQQDDFRRYDDDDDWRQDDFRRRKPDFEQMQRQCSRAGIEEAWDRNYYSAQYSKEPRFYEGRYGWELRGKMKLHGRSGYSYTNTVCSLDRGGVDFEFTR
jgi:hypothetical protein